MLTKRLCYKCLTRGSKAHNCLNCSAPDCGKCHKAHNTVLHLETNRGSPVSVPEASSTSEVTAQASSQANEGVGSTSINVAPSSSSTKLLKTLLITAKQGETCKRLRALVDSGSDEAWVTSELKQQLNLPVIATRVLAVGTAFSTKFTSPQKSEVVRVSLMTETGDIFPVKALVHEGPIVAPLKDVEIDPQKVYPHLAGLNIADFYPRGPQQIDLILGTAYEEKIKSGERRTAKEGPDAVKTLFGLVISGELSAEKGEQVQVTCNRIA